MTMGDPNQESSNALQSTDLSANLYLSTEVVGGYSANDAEINKETTASRLKRTCYMDEIPGNPEVRKDFGFDR
jgi:hypothetical protein